MLMGNSRSFVLISVIGRLVALSAGTFCLWYILAYLAAGLGLGGPLPIVVLVISAVILVVFYRDLATFVPMWEATGALFSLSQIIGLSMYWCSYLWFPNASGLIITSFLIVAVGLTFQMGQLIVGGLRALKQPAEVQKRRKKLADYRASDPAARRIKLEEHQASPDGEWSLKV